MAGKTTSPKVATEASGFLHSGSTGTALKSAGGSALSQAKLGKVTSTPAAKQALELLGWPHGCQVEAAAALALSRKVCTKKQ